LARELGQSIDGAWWPRTGRIAAELPELVAVLSSRLGEILDIKVNWSSSVDPPKLDSYGWEGRRQPVMTISGRDACANLLIVSHRTSTALAVMVLRSAAGLAVTPAHRVTQAFQTADSIVRAARMGSTSGDIAQRALLHARVAKR
jgi:Family of unknown function (DUF5994)